MSSQSDSKHQWLHDMRCLLLEEARDELLRSGGCLAVVEDGRLGSDQPFQREGGWIQG